MAHLWQVVVLCLLSPVVRLSSVTPTMTESSVTNGTESFVKNVTGDEFENYEYDAEASFNTFNWPELLTALAVYGVTMVLGIVGNSLIIFTICRYRRMKSITNVFLASLASADLLLIIICIPVKIAKLFSYTWGMGLFLCKSVHYMQSVSTICSVLTLTAMSIERYYAIVHPMKAKYICTISQAKKIIGATWIASFMLAIPMLFAQNQILVGERIQGYWCVRDWDNKALWRFHELFMLLLVLVVPTGVMVVAYTSICLEVWRVMQQRQDMTGFTSDKQGESLALKSSRSFKSMNSHHSGNSTCGARESLKKVNNVRVEEETSTVKQVIKMLVAVVVLFVICWCPLLIDNVLTAYNVLPNIRQGYLKHISTAFHLMAYFNSCINPIVYGFMSRNFRESFFKALCACCYRGRRLNRNMSVSQTRTTSVRFTRSAASSTTAY